MKKSIIFIAAIIFAICFTACGNSGEKNTQTETTTNGIKLTEEQLEYLKKLRSDITGIEYVSEEDLNRMLLGTGMEIYNPSSGVEVFGLEYNKKSGFDYLAASDSNKKMTLSDVRKFRNKEKEMRIEDLTEYAYTVSEKTLNNSGEKSIIYELDAPITDYENTYMKIWFEIKDDKIKMQVPQLIYRNEADGKTTAFSINYNPMPIESFFENNDYSFENKMIVSVQYSSPRKKSIVLNAINWTDYDYHFNGTCDIYKADTDGNKKEKATTGTYETMTIGGRNNDKYTGWNYLDITFEDELPSGDYIIEVKTDGKNKFTKDLPFTIE